MGKFEMKDFGEAKKNRDIMKIFKKSELIYLNLAT